MMAELYKLSQASALHCSYRVRHDRFAGANPYGCRILAWSDLGRTFEDFPSSVSPDALKTRAFACLCFVLVLAKSLACLVGGLWEDLAPNTMKRESRSYFF